MSRKKHSKELKARIALDAIKGQKTMSELASEYGVHSNQIGRWKKQLLESAPDILPGEKTKRLRRKRLNEIVYIKRLDNCRSKWTG